MSSQYYLIQPKTIVQAPWQPWVAILTPLYQRYVSCEIRQRRNANHAKISDVTIMALMCWQVSLGITNQCAFYRLLVGLGFTDLPERSRFNRRCTTMGCLLQTLRVGLVKHCLLSVTYTIIDSFPIPLCQSIRNHRAKVLRSIADIGYNATKKQWFYGLKGHFQVTNQGIVVAYSISAASIYDIRLVPELIDQYACSHVLADVGHLSQPLKDQLKQRHIDFWTPKRRNMPQSRQNSTLLKRQRRMIETLFSKWQVLFQVEHNRGRCLRGFKSRLEQLLFVDTWQLIN
ncbi:IS982 family transposase [Lactiplantibacillus plantarum]|uniref:IS982 family transposase n=1 Tax=Lactiplantibacillus plantarum TaxID=1590 RepID=UPI000D2F8C39|nr:IS982 family transposase [Lactiplantibacillus plantarum]PTM27002.1 IS982 family transposase [Lactiplantibacillus plantarum]